MKLRNSADFQAAEFVRAPKTPVISRPNSGESGQVALKYSFEYCSRFGEEIAALIAKRLGWDLVDREIIENIAKHYKVPETLVEFVDERHVAWLTELFQSFIETQSFCQVYDLTIDTSRFEPEAVAELIEAAMKLRTTRTQ